MELKYFKVDEQREEEYKTEKGNLIKSFFSLKVVIN